MTVVSFFACIYRRFLEHRLDPEGFKARAEVHSVRKHHEREDEEFMEEVIKREHEGSNLNGDSSSQ
jgi:hypothetical protein